MCKLNGKIYVKEKYIELLSKLNIDKTGNMTYRYNENTPMDAKKKTTYLSKKMYYKDV